MKSNSTIAKRLATQMWGKPDHQHKLADGIWEFSTPRHGGIIVDIEVRPLLREYVTEVTPAQYAALRTLKLNGLYKGKLPKIHLSACPICGAEAELSAVKPDRASKASYKYNCSNTALHVSCGDWFNTKLKAQQDWERRCTGYGQPEFYKPTNEEHIRSIIRRNSGAQLIDAIRDIYKPISAYSSREAAARWLAMRYVPDKCVGCAKNQRKYCICTKEESK